MLTIKTGPLTILLLLNVGCCYLVSLRETIPQLPNKGVIATSLLVDILLDAKNKINGQSGLSSEHKEICGVTCTGILGAVVGVDDWRNKFLPITIFFTKANTIILYIFIYLPNYSSLFYSQKYDGSRLTTY